MQEVQYRDKDGALQKAREFFGGQTQEEIFDKMRARFKEQESEVEVMAMKREKIGRNAPCPCGSGVKFKKCCISQVR